MRKIFLSIAILSGLASQASAADNYNATAGSGLVFGAKDAAGVLYSRFIGCDNTTVSQCWTIDSSGRLAIQAPSGSFASGAFASGSIAAGAQVDLLTMRGTVAAGTAAANALLTGCIYNSTPITLTNGQGAAVQCSANGYPTVVVSNTNANGQATMANSSPVTIASNQTANALWGHGATGAAVPANATYFGFNSGGNLTGPAVATPLPVRQSDGTNVVALDPCQTETPAYANINLSASGAAKVITGVSAKKVYICSIHMVTNAANSVALVEGTGTNCGTSKTAVLGGATAATGWNFSANGGIALGNGASSVVASTVNADDVCLDPSAATQLTGMIKWVSR